MTNLVFIDPIIVDYHLAFYFFHFFFVLFLFDLVWEKYNTSWFWRFWRFDNPKDFFAKIMVATNGKRCWYEFFISFSLVVWFSVRRIISTLVEIWNNRRDLIESLENPLELYYFAVIKQKCNVLFWSQYSEHRVVAKHITQNLQFMI